MFLNTHACTFVLKFNAAQWHYLAATPNSAAVVTFRGIQFFPSDALLTMERTFLTIFPTSDAIAIHFSANGQPF